MKRYALMVFAVASVMAVAESKKSSDSHTIQKVDIPDLKGAEVCLAITQDANDHMDWLLTCLDGKRRYLVHEKRVATEKSVGDDEITFGDLEMTVEMQNRGFRLVSTQDGLFFTRK
jgi:hypothetical protein